MSFFGRYVINGWHGKKYFMTAKKLYERVLEDSKSDLNWIAPATELVRICEEPDFPEEYAREIKIRILRCFANFETEKEYPNNLLPTDIAAVQNCYNSMAYSTDAYVIYTRKRYFSAVLDGIIKYDTDSVRFPIHYGPRYRKVCDNWKNAMMKEYFSAQPIEKWKRLRAMLEAEFYNAIKAAEKQGVLAEEDEKNCEDFIRNNHIQVPEQQGISTDYDGR